MKAICLKDFLASLVLQLTGDTAAIAGISAEISDDPHFAECSILAFPSSDGSSLLGARDHLTLGSFALDLQQIKESDAEIILTAEELSDRALSIARETLLRATGRPIKIATYEATSLEAIFSMYEDVAKFFERGPEGRALARKVQAQAMDWCSNFYDRIKNKRVTLLSGIEPFRLRGQWVPDMIRLASSHPQLGPGCKEDVEVSWEALVKFNPDVLIVAPSDLTYDETLRSFKMLEQQPDWEKIYAVKRGDVYFTDGRTFFSSPVENIISSMGVLISALAGLESGYITERESFFKLRTLELQRHKYL